MNMLMFFFFSSRRRHTRSDRDWSSDVCSSDLELQRIVRRCLAKDPDERYQSIKEVAIELKELRRELETSTGIDTTVPPPRSTTELSTDGGPMVQSTAARSGSIPPTISSAEYLVSGIKKHKLSAGVA